MSIYFIGVLISIVGYIIVGNYAGRKVKNIDDYYVSGRQAPTLLIAGTLFASMLSTNGFMGDTAYAYTGFITSIVLLNTFTAGGYIIGPIFFGRYLRRMKPLTMPEYFGNRFNSKNVKRFAGIVTVISMSAYLLAVMQGTNILLTELTGLSPLVCLLIAWACFTSFTFYSGSSGVILTDTIMFIIFIAATVIAGPYVFKEAGGFSTLVTNLMASANTPKDLLAYHGNLGTGTVFDAMSYSIITGVIWLLTVSVSPWQASRNLMAKNEHVTIRAGVVACICTTLFLTFLYAIAISMNLINPNIQPSEKVMIWAAFNVMPKIIGVFVLTGIMAAGLSSASTFLSLIGFSFANDVLDIKFKNDKQKLLVTRLSMLVFSIVAVILAYSELSIIRIISWFASTLIVSSWGVVAYMSVWSKKITSKGAFFGMVVGFFGFLIPRTINALAGVSYFKNFTDPFIIGIILSYIAVLIGNKLSSRTSEEIKFLEDMHVMPEEEKDIKLYKRTFIYGKVLIVGGVIISTVLIIFWVLPYMNAVGK